MKKTSLLLVLAALVLPVTQAHACWDGFAASVGRVTVLESSENTEWEPRDVEETALWLGRLNALLPAAGSLHVEHGLGELDCGAGPVEFAWQGGWPQRFREVARQCQVTASERARAMATVTPVFTVQLAATHDQAQAERLAESVNARELDASGFIEVGGFPATNPSAHVVSEGSLHRVWVGAFVSREQAEQLAATLEGGYVRPMQTR